MKLLVQLLLVALSSQHSVLAARILAIFPIIAKSHHLNVIAIVRTLVSRGHEVVLYTPFPWDQPLPNVTIVHLDNLGSAKKEWFETFMSYSPIGLSIPLLKTSTGVVENVYKNKKILDLIDSDEHFDLVLLQVFNSQEPLLAFGKKFNAPVIAIHPFGNYGPANKVMGNPLNLAYIPDFGNPVSDKMSFFERLMNAYSILLPLYYYYTEHLPAQTKLMRKTFKDPTLPPVEELVQNISLVFNNAHPNVHYIQPYTPNVIPIGGIHLQSESKQLLPEIKKFLDEASDGVIYFSLGSSVPDEDLGEEFFAKFMNVFRHLPQRVLWKSNAEVRNLPRNVMISKWVPQQDVLAHPNVLVFITHGGLYSQHEAIHAGVPVVCIPLMWDQPMNAKLYEAKEIGVRLFLNTLSEKTIHDALTTVINDPKYRDNMARMSLIYRDRPLSPADTLVYWVEYTLRHGGASHLRPAAASISFYELYLLDVAGTILVVFFLILYVTSLFSIMFYRKLVNLLSKYPTVIILEQQGRKSSVTFDYRKVLGNKLD